MNEPKTIEGRATRRAPKTPAWMWIYLMSGGGFFFWLAGAASNWTWPVILGAALGGFIFGTWFGAVLWHRNDGVRER